MTGVTVTALALVAVLGPGVPAQAKPTPAQIDAQVNSLNNQIEKLVEQYNGAKVKLAADKAKQASLEKQIAPQQLQADVAHAQLGSIASTLYMNGTNHTLQALLSGSDTSSLLDALGTLNEMARSQRTVIDGAAAKVAQFKTQEAPLTALIAKEQVQVTAMAAQKKKIEAQLVTAQKLQDEEASSGGGGGGGSNVGSGPYTKKQLMPVACPDGSGSGNGYKAAVKACSLVWKPGVSRYKDTAGKGWIMYHYAEASESAGYDCSGLTMTAWKAGGKSLAHFTGDQWDESTAEKSQTQSGLKIGDLVFYNSGNHVAIYVGGGYIVQAEHTGAPIMMSKLYSQSPVKSGFRTPK
jgi:cell wall-associated NlpC family hydrolase